MWKIDIIEYILVISILLPRPEYFGLSYLCYINMHGQKCNYYFHKMKSLFILSSTAHQDCFSYNLTNAETNITLGMEGATLQFTCNVGYAFDGGLVGDEINITCLSNGTLEKDIPSCNGKT